VNVGVYLLDLYKLDDVAQTFSADLILSMSWRDPRLAAGMTAAGEKQRSYPLGEVWNPEPMLLNERSVDAEGPELVLVDADGVCRYSQRLRGVYSFKSDLTDFPLDQQTLPVQVVVPPRAGEVVLVEDAQLSGLWEEVSIPNWRLGQGYRKRCPRLATDAWI